jgi:hypothetical protein
LCALPSLHVLAQQAGPEVVRRQLHDLSPAALGVVALLAFITALSIKVSVNASYHTIYYFYQLFIYHFYCTVKPFFIFEILFPQLSLLNLSILFE